MAKLQLSLAILANERSNPIIEGAVQPQGIDLTISVRTRPGEIFWRQLHFHEFDISEMSLSEMLMLISRGDRSWVMLPVFMTRKFFHSAILVRKDAGIATPADLRGKRVGVPEYIQTAGLWARGALKDEFGVQPKEMQWFQERGPAMSHSTMFGVQPGEFFQTIPENKTIGGMMAAGELDAVVHYTGAPGLVDRSSVNLGQHPDVKRLFPKPREEEVRYYRKTGIFPMNHAVVIKRAVVEQHPWVVLNLYQMFLAAKKHAVARFKETLALHAAIGSLNAETSSALDKDPLPYGIKNNRHALETCARYAYEEGLCCRQVAVDELFAEATLNF